MKAVRALLFVFYLIWLPVLLPADNDCHIYDLVAEVTPCEDGQFYVILNFFYENVSGDGFQVVGNGNNYGTFSYSEVPLTLGPIQGDGTTVYEFGVSDLAFPDCGDATFIDPVDCGGDPCEIYELVVDPGECDADGFYDLYIDFLVQNPGNDFFEVFYGTELLGYFALSELPVVIENFSDDGEPVVHIKVCINDSDPACCKVAEFESPCEGGGDVWPGDANADNIANNIDLLSLGIAFGAIGPTRDVPGIEWNGWASENWVEDFPNGVNFKHADCDGTGHVDEDDLEAIELNYNETHGTPLPVEYSEGTEDDPPLYADLLLPGTPGPGTPIVIPIVLGTADLPVEDIYGIAFTLHFDPEIIDPASVSLLYPNSWMGAPGVNLLVIDQKFLEEGVIDLALTRIDANPVSGFGEILNFIGIIDDVLGKHELTIELSKVRAIRFDEQVIDLRFPAQTLLISSNREPSTQAESIAVFPNPAGEEIHWRLANNDVADYTAVADLNGRVLLEQSGSSQQLSIHGLPAGMYWLKVQAGEQVYIARFVKF